jgi:hypothetical protein
LQIVLIEEAVDRRLQVSDGDKGAAPEAALGQDGEEASTALSPESA